MLTRKFVVEEFKTRFKDLGIDNVNFYSVNKTLITIVVNGMFKIHCSFNYDDIIEIKDVEFINIDRLNYMNQQEMIGYLQNMLYKIFSIAEDINQEY